MEARFRRRGSFGEAVRFRKDAAYGGSGVQSGQGTLYDEGTDSDKVCAFSSALSGTCGQTPGRLNGFVQKRCEFGQTSVCFIGFCPKRVVIWTNPCQNSSTLSKIMDNLDKIAEKIGCFVQKEREFGQTLVRFNGFCPK